MYNAELKNRFISECASSENQSKRAKLLFGYSAQFETMYGKDLCAISSENIGEVLERVVSPRIGTQAVDMSVLKKYARWCIENHIDGACDAIIGFSDVDANRLRETMVSGPSHLQDIFDLAFPSVDDGKSENLCRGYLWLAFIGLTEEDIVQIEANHVDLRHMVIRFNGKEYPIYKEAVPVLRHLCTAGSFYYDYVTREAILPRALGCKILRGTGESSDPNIASIRRAINRRMKDSVVNGVTTLRYLSIKLSGTLYRMYVDEVNNGECDTRKGLFDHYGDISNLSVKRRNRKEFELRTDYERWKIAFNK